MNTGRVITIVSHDAGGAEILASYVAKNNATYQLVLEGPAINIFKRRLGAIEIVTLDEGISSGDWCLCGTGWQSDLEWNAIEQTKNNGKRVIAFLDHWVNYQERFIRNGKQHLPDEIWVGDDSAENLAKKYFPLLPVKLVANPYFVDIKRQICELGSSTDSSDQQHARVLLVCDNISGHARLRYGDERYYGYTEFEAIEYFLQNTNIFESAIHTIVLRPHPSDPPGKYNKILESHKNILKLSTGKSLIEEIAEADMVVGGESMAMVIGLLAKKKVVSCIPPGGQPCHLPHQDIVHLRDLTIW